MYLREPYKFQNHLLPDTCWSRRSTWSTFYSERGILYYSTPRKESFYYSTPREESFTVLPRERNPLLFYSERGILYVWKDFA